MLRGRDEVLGRLGRFVNAEVYFRGRKIMNLLEDDVLSVAIRHAARLFEYPDRGYFNEELRENISKFYRVPRNTQDLLERHRLIYDTTMFSYGWFNISQAIGSDALFALLIVSKKVDEKYGTDYYSRVRKYYEYVAKNDLTIAVAQTDVKGHRKKRPHEQEDPDVYVHVVEKRNDGIVVKGAKAHTTQSVASDELIVLPTRAMIDRDRDYAIAFAIPTDTKGVKYLVRDTGKGIIGGRAQEVETITVFDDVFVPWDRVFLFGEYDFAGELAVDFATFHRFTAISYRSATANLYLGAASLIAKANGIETAPHVRNDLLNIILYKEIMRMGALAAALTPIIDQGVAIPNPIFTNVAKLYSNDHFIDVVKSVIDIAGGIIATLPSEADIENPTERQLLVKYLRGAVSGEERLELIRLVRELASSGLTGYMLTGMIHAEGSEEASRIELSRQYPIKEAEDLIIKILKS
ncbi:MAG: 4-hydroxyphenylacetate 3-hydroxylase N-terminal domain-containing protein [Vulcanisaeta sp. AZ3]|nr:MAG: 4-hydroxybutyryl-CoA dehydratase [Vulcanisaeta sp. AZ3]